MGLGKLIPGKVMSELGFSSCKGQLGVPRGAAGELDDTRDAARPSQEAKEV